jgi:hypothetical protein
VLLIIFLAVEGGPFTRKNDSHRNVIHQDDQQQGVKENGQPYQVGLKAGPTMVNGHNAGMAMVCLCPGGHRVLDCGTTVASLQIVSGYLESNNGTMVACGSDGPYCHKGRLDMLDMLRYYYSGGDKVQNGTAMLGWHCVLVPVWIELA